MASDFCFICLKTSGGKWRNDSVQNIFWKFARDYLKINHGSQDFYNSGDSGVSFCDGCDQVVSSISELYLELRGVQLRLAWKLGELDNLLNSSEGGGSAPEKGGVGGVLSLATRWDRGDRAYRLQGFGNRAQKAQEYCPKISTLPHDVSFEEEIVVKLEPGTFSTHEGDVDIFDETYNSNNDSGSDWDPQKDFDDSYNDQTVVMSEDRVSTTRKRKKTTKSIPKKQSTTKPKGEDGSSWNCEICGPTTSQKVVHLRGHEQAIKTKEFPCLFATRLMVFSSPLSIMFLQVIPKKNHYNLYHGAFLKTHKCSECGALCTSSHALWIHIQNYHKGNDKARKKKAARKAQLSGGPQTCQECLKEFKNKFQMDQHHTHHHKPTPCEVCGEIFIGRSALREHRITTHNFKDNLNGDEGETFECTICSKTFAKRIQLVRHSSDVHGKAEFRCEICQKTFKRRICLRIHLKKSHADVKDEPQICPHCGKACADHKSLVSHIGRVHPTFSNGSVGERDHPGEEIAEGMLECPVCGVRMGKGENSKMEYHMETHMTIEERRREGKLHICHVCGKEFRTIYAYKRHVKKHDET
ncbi:putative zinc finger protein [Orchesella cincta]|uniref:Putative zinc finger protein n=1 Tax=Orchesella cincta TaxID=48709 RepID=A0A1D2MCP0_ORCCI|nr:putative zinc finger protein [Orchesella cincta]